LLLVLNFVVTKVSCKDLEEIQVADNAILEAPFDEGNKSIGELNWSLRE
jgi:hypothetical protein